jgi:serine/threonine protein kinase
MESANFIGQILDTKYKIEKELGRGGMGTVYLATHVGTERPVALKIIAPQFMQKREFVERFRREARAAGRLRHPNVVNVTDFGFAATKHGNVAYLVMEYLDGVTLGEVLEEEKKLPLSWTIDILEQVCSAVQEAHNQGIIHRDLKPDNIWLEPNQRGGYTVKVLDFGIAKLEENMASEAGSVTLNAAPTTTTHSHQGTTIADATQPNTIIENRSSTIVSEGATVVQTDQISALDTEAGTMLQPNGDTAEDKTAILPQGENKTVSIDKNAGTKLISEQIETGKSPIGTPVTSELTRVGAVLGTPLYMSPEQCRGERLNQSSDIYSLGVIAYQMLSGDTPFTGDFKTVMESHKEVEPPPLNAGNVPRKVKKVISSALSKNADERPPSAEAFAGGMVAQSEGIWTLLRRALVIYSEHLPKFLGIATLLSLPMIFLTLISIFLSFLKVSGVIPNAAANISIAATSIVLSLVSAFCAYLINGATTWVVAHYLAVPLRPIKLRPAFRAAFKRWKTFAATTLLTFLVGGITCGIGFLVTMVIWTLVAPVVMMENLRGWQALKRSTRLVRRSLATTIAAVLIMFIIPVIFSGSIYYIVTVSAIAFDKTADEIQAVQQAGKTENNAQNPAAQKEEKGINISFGNNLKKEGEKDMRTRVKNTILETLIQIFWLPMHIFVISFCSIIIALLYLKTRQAGGESMNELLGQFEDTDRAQSNWQKRVRERLIQSGRISSRASQS